MNETFRLIRNRKSTRAYLDKPVSSENRALILEAAMRAPTAGNQMLYSIVHVSDQTLKDRLAQTCDHQPFIAKAPLVLLFLADYHPRPGGGPGTALAYTPGGRPVHRALRRPDRGPLLGAGRRVAGDRFLLYRRYHRALRNSP